MEEDGDLGFSDWGAALSRPSGILRLMDDLGSALAGAGDDLVMMGGGNPAHIPEVEAVWAARLRTIAGDPSQISSVLADYDPPRGRGSFLAVMAGYLNRRFGWEVTPDHLAITAGGQQAHFLLFNLLAGRRGGSLRRIGFPLVPEYIGYADQVPEPGALVGCPPAVETTGAHRFKYRIDFDALAAEEDVAAWCLSRPTNPTANVVADDELARLSTLARERGARLLIDHAYGDPFPGVVFAEARLPTWEPHHVSTFSLSKLGLPNTRTAVVCAEPALIERLVACGAVLGLANGTIGQAIVEPLLADGTVDRLCAEVIRPYYRERCRATLALIDRELAGLDYAVHEPEGAFFLWLHLPGMEIDDRGCYHRLKEAGLLVVPGSYFFPGYDGDWDHRRSCLRLSYCQPPARIERGIRILAEVLREAVGYRL